MGVILKNGIYYSGPPGSGIWHIVQNSDYSLTITLTDGTSYTTEPVKGPDGVGIESVTFNPNSTITITLSDESEYVSGPLNYLPPVTSADIGKTLIVNENSLWDTEDVWFETWTKYEENEGEGDDDDDEEEIPSQQNAVVIAERLPIVTAADAGKIMMVNSSGEWEAIRVEYGDGVGY